jgi:hypothetical protein
MRVLRSHPKNAIVREYDYLPCSRSNPATARRISFSSSRTLSSLANEARWALRCIYNAKHALKGRKRMKCNEQEDTGGR